MERYGLTFISYNIQDVIDIFFGVMCTFNCFKKVNHEFYVIKRKCD